MTDRDCLNSMHWLRSSLTMLAIVALVLVAPVRMFGNVAGSYLSECLEEQFAQRTVEPTILSSDLAAPDAVPQVSALAPEIEKPLGESALGESRVFLLMPWCFRKALDRRLIASPSVLSHYHLRC